MNEYLIIKEVADEYGISLTDYQMQKMVDFIGACPSLPESVLQSVILATLEYFFD